MVEAYYQLLENCCAKVKNGKEGTAFFVSPCLAITCAHVVPDDKKEKDWIEITPYGMSAPVEVQILALKRDTFEDYCILQTATFTANSFVILNRKTDVLKQGCALLGFGFPALEYLQLESFDGNYVGPIIPGEAGKYKFPSHKLKDGQIKPGFSGSPVINTRTGRCIGVVSKTFDKFSSLGGWVISADLYLSRLELLEEYWPVDNSQMATKWENAARLHLEDEPETNEAYVGEPYSKAYTCDRTIFSRNYKAFDQYSVSKHLQVNHHLIAGKAMHSPAGLARKLIYENIVSKTTGYFYPSNPEKPGGRSVKLKVDYTTTIEDFLRELRLLYIIDPEEKRVLMELSEKQLYSDLVRNFNANSYNLHIVSVEFPGNRHLQHEIFKFLKEFTELLEEKTQMIRSKVFFFWCFVPGRFSFSDGASSILQSVVIGKRLFQSTSWYLISLIPLLNQIVVRAALKKLAPPDYFIWPVNQAAILRKPPDEYIRNWITEINAGKPIVDEAWTKKILRENNTTKIEIEFIKIIDKYNQPSS